MSKSSNQAASEVNVETEGSSVRSRSSGRTLAILGFHKIGEPSPDGWETWFYVPEATFAGHLSYLRENGWQVIDLATFLRGLRKPKSLPEWAALLTFDDGYRSMRTVALPWLLRFGYPAVLFVPTGFIGGRNIFDTAEPEEALCDWDDLVELERQGVSVQSHGISHRPFSDLTSAEQEEELRRSKTTLEAGLGKRVEVFSYPYGDDGVSSYPYGDDDGASSQVPRKVRETLRRAGYRAACLYGGGPNRLPAADPYRLTRLAVGPDTDLQAELREEQSQ
jgi:peptidoglycan/xylan/chitin deacetylase (PgdA/CDA1 family)